MGATPCRCFLHASFSCGKPPHGGAAQATPVFLCLEKKVGYAQAHKLFLIRKGGLYERWTAAQGDGRREEGQT